MSRTSHPSEEQIVLRLFGRQDELVEAHLATCDACRAEQAELEETLDLAGAAPVPDRGDQYGAEVWRRIRPQLVQSRRRGAEARGWVLAGTAAALLLTAFLAGRHWPVPSNPIPGQARERILLVAVGDHLERAQMMLVELVNADHESQSGSTIDISGAQRRAEDLVAANRVYRRATASAGDAAMTALLDELERVLLDLAHRPSQPTPEELEQIRRSVESKGILFKVRFIGSQVREREKESSPEPNKTPARGST